MLNRLITKYDTSTFVFFIIFVFWPLYSQYSHRVFLQKDLLITTSAFFFVAAFVILGQFLFSFDSYKEAHKDLLTIPIYLLFCQFLLTSLYYWPLMVELLGMVEGSNRVGRDFFFPLVYFFSGLSFAFMSEEKMQARSIVLFGLLTVVFILIMTFSYDYDSVGYGMMRFYLSEYEKEYNYQIIGDSVAFLGLASLSFIRGNKRILLFSIYSFLLYIMGSLASLTSFLLTTIVFYFLFNTKGNYIFRFFFFFMIGVVVISLATILEFDFAELFEMIVFNISVSSRLDIMNQNFEIMLNHFWGYYHFEIFMGRMGTHTHNILSMWEQYGLVSFVVFSLVLYVSFVRSLKKISNSWGLFSTLIILYCIIQISFARSIFFYQIWFPIGLSLAIYRRENAKLLDFNASKETSG